MIRIKCPRCETFLRIDDTRAGVVVACPKCSQKLRVPSPKAPTSDEPPEEQIQAAPSPQRPAPTHKPAPPLARPSVPSPDTARAAERDDESDRSEADSSNPPPSPRRLPRFDTEPYQVVGGVSPAGAAILLAFLLPAAVVCGFLASWIGQWFYLIVVFPAGIALGVIVCGVLGIQLGKVHSPLFSASAGLLAGTLAMLSMHYFDYRRVMAEIEAQNPGAQIERPGLFGYLNMRAKVGVALAGRGGSKINLGHIGSWIYFTLEYLFVAGMCTGLLITFARAPFCTGCNNWKQERKLGAFTLPVDEVPKETIDNAVDAFKKGKVVRLVNDDPDAEKTVTLALVAFVCPHCADIPIDVDLKSVEQNDKGETSLVDLARVTYPAEALPVLENLCPTEPETEEPEEPAAQ